jgi:hypothetical protein
LVNAPAAAPGVTIDGFEITSSNMGVDGIHCKAPGAGHQLRVRNSYIHDVQGDGLHNANCDLTIEDNKVSGTNVRAIEDANTITPKYVIQRNVFMNGNGDGIYVGAPGGGGSGVDLTFDRNTVANYNAGNGLQIFGSGSYRITNSFFYLNERAFALSTNGNSPVKLFQFNTVVLNPLTGLFNSNCDNAVLESSIIVQNGEGAAAVSMCKQDHVVIDSDAGAPHFVDSNNASTYDFHLAIAKNADLTANTACCIDRVPLTFDAGAPLSDHDYDGTKRPLGAGYDIGAHEAK